MIPFSQTPGGNTLNESVQQINKESLFLVVLLHFIHNGTQNMLGYSQMNFSQTISGYKKQCLKVGNHENVADRATRYGSAKQFDHLRGAERW